MTKSASTILIAILVIVTFPIWIGLAGGIFGLVAGLFGAVIGIIAAIFGGIGWFFGGAFNNVFDCDFYPVVHMSRFTTMVLLVLIVVLISRNRSQKQKSN